MSPVMGDVTVSKGRNFGNLLKGLIPGVAGTAVNFLFDAFSANKQRKLAKDAWDKQVEYNSPHAMIQRYKAAGMHPAYGAANFNQAAPTFQNSISSVATAKLPDLTSSMEQYQNTKNLSIRSESMAQEVYNERMKNRLLSESLQSMIDANKLKPRQQDINYQLSQTKLNNDYMLGVAKFFSMLQNYEQKERMNPLEYLLKDINVKNADIGITTHDSPFLRVLLRGMFGGNKDSNSFMPYVLGDRFTNFMGDLVKIGIPSGAISKMFGGSKPIGEMWKGTGRSNTSLKKMPIVYE